MSFTEFIPFAHRNTPASYRRKWKPVFSSDESLIFSLWEGDILIYSRDQNKSIDILEHGNISRFQTSKNGIYISVTVRSPSGKNIIYKLIYLDWFLKNSRNFTVDQVLLMIRYLKFGPGRKWILPGDKEILQSFNQLQSISEMEKEIKNKVIEILSS